MNKTIFLLLFLVFNGAHLQRVTKNVVHMCNPYEARSCGSQGVCMIYKTGNRCRCSIGAMGIQCRRPCQDIYKSCDRWKKEGRCGWTTRILPFFEDNCAETCEVCKSNGRRLKVAVPPILEPISWLVGRWEAKSTSGKHFPKSLEGPYLEILDISIAEIPMFDRPALNISVTTKTEDTHSEYREFGFITLEPFNEDTGFVVFDKPLEGFDKVAIEMVSTAGLTTIEIGELKNKEIVLELKDFKTLFPNQLWSVVTKSKRNFRANTPTELTETTEVEYGNGIIDQWRKHYRKIEDYLNEAQ